MAIRIINDETKAGKVVRVAVVPAACVPVDDADLMSRRAGDIARERGCSQWRVVDDCGDIVASGNAPSYMVTIQAGNGGYRVVRGWDEVYADRREAEECANRARKLDGWEARVIEVDDEPTVTETREQRMMREWRERGA